MPPDSIPSYRPRVKRVHFYEQSKLTPYLNSFYNSQNLKKYECSRIVWGCKGTNNYANKLKICLFFYLISTFLPFRM